MSAKKKALELLAELLETRGSHFVNSHKQPPDAEDGTVDYGDAYDAEWRGRGEGYKEAARMLKDLIKEAYPLERRH